MRERPTSPHLTIYRFQYTMALSILHRITGVILSVGLLPLAYWLTAIAAGPSAYERALSLLASWPFKLLLAGWIAAFSWHLVNGIRHLSWDSGFGFERAAARASARVAVVVATVVALLLLGFAFAAHGGAP
jgi:succinate dehydrogenase / fumarate reductase cytochrome b subunit